MAFALAFENGGVLGRNIIRPSLNVAIEPLYLWLEIAYLKAELCELLDRFFVPELELLEGSERSL